MKKLMCAVFVLSLMAATGYAQDESDLPYTRGGVDAFVDLNQSMGLQSVVLYNFDLTSG